MLPLSRLFSLLLSAAFALSLCLHLISLPQFFSSHWLYLSPPCFLSLVHLGSIPSLSSSLISLSLTLYYSFCLYLLCLLVPLSASFSPCHSTSIALLSSLCHILSLPLPIFALSLSNFNDSVSSQSVHLSPFLSCFSPHSPCSLCRSLAL